MLLCFSYLFPGSLNIYIFFIFQHVLPFIPCFFFSKIEGSDLICTLQIAQLLE